ncbi:MAG TPA: hypothetical protein VGK71_04210, partial [Nitrospirota bacterium]
MDIVKDSDILQVIRKFNPWHLDGSYKAKYQYRRIAYYEVCDWFFSKVFKRAILISGLRRTGKTVILMQVAEKL